MAHPCSLLPSFVPLRKSILEPWLPPMLGTACIPFSSIFRSGPQSKRPHKIVHLGLEFKRGEKWHWVYAANISGELLLVSQFMSNGKCQVQSIVFCKDTFSIGTADASKIGNPCKDKKGFSSAFANATPIFQAMFWRKIKLGAIQEKITEQFIHRLLQGSHTLGWGIQQGGAW